MRAAGIADSSQTFTEQSLQVREGQDGNNGKI